MLASRLVKSRYIWSLTALRGNASSAVPDELYKRISVDVLSHDAAVLRSYGQFASLASKELDLSCEQSSVEKRAIERRSLLKSKHIYKAHFVQYELRTYGLTLRFRHLTGSTAETLLEYLQRHLPEGVAMQVERVRIEQLPDQLAKQDAH